MRKGRNKVNIQSRQEALAYPIHDEPVRDQEEVCTELVSILPKAEPDWCPLQSEKYWELTRKREVDAKKIQEKVWADSVKFWNNCGLSISCHQDLLELFSKRFPFTLAVCRSKETGRLFPIVEKERQSFVAQVDGKLLPFHEGAWSKPIFYRRTKYLGSLFFTNPQLARVYFEHSPKAELPENVVSIDEARRRKRQHQKLKTATERRKANSRNAKTLNVRNEVDATQILSELLLKLVALNRPFTFSYVKDKYTKNFHPVILKKGFEYVILRDGLFVRLDLNARLIDVQTSPPDAQIIGKLGLTLRQLRELISVTINRLASLSRAQELSRRKPSPSRVRSNSDVHLEASGRVKHKRRKKRKMKRGENNQDAMGINPATGRPRWVRGF